MMDLGGPPAQFRYQGDHAGPIAGTADYMSPEQSGRRDQMTSGPTFTAWGVRSNYLLVGEPVSDLLFGSATLKMAAHQSYPFPIFGRNAPDVPAAVVTCWDRWSPKIRAAAR